MVTFDNEIFMTMIGEGKQNSTTNRSELQESNVETRQNRPEGPGSARPTMSLPAAALGIELSELAQAL